MSEEESVTPLNMLHDFQANSDPWLIEQARLFGMMPPSQQRELLFWMILNTGIDLEAIKGAFSRAIKH